MRALILRQADALACKEHDRVLARALGVLAAAGFGLLWAGARLDALTRTKGA